MKTLVIYHSADFDGKFSGAVCLHWLKKMGNDVTLVGWDFGDPQIDIDDWMDFNTEVYVVDLPLECMAEPTDAGHMNLIWIDHHKSSIEKYGDGFDGLRMDGVAACRLAWQWFLDPIGAEAMAKTAYTDRCVSEPLALTLAGEYDVWDKRDPRADQFQFGLYGETWTPERLTLTFFTPESPDEARDMYVAKYCEDGAAIMKWQKVFATSVCKHRGYMVELGGNRYWCLASVHARNSSWFPNEVVPVDANGVMCYRIEGDGQAKVSLYNREGCEDVDHSVIAVEFGGGGHKGACGFSVPLEKAVALGILR